MLCRHPVNWPMCVFIIPIRCPQMFQMEVRPVQIGDLPGEIGEPMWEARILKQVQKAHTHTDTETHKESFFPSECGVGVRVFFIIHIPRSRVWFIAPSYHHSHLLSPWCCPRLWLAPFHESVSTHGRGKKHSEGQKNKRIRPSKNTRLQKLAAGRDSKSP